MNCKEIVEKYLKENGFDGLYNTDECSCIIGDLIPCDDDFSCCKPGYKHKNVEWQGEQVDFVFSGDKLYRDHTG